MALPIKNRLKNRKDIDHVFKEGRTVRGSSLFVKAVKNNFNHLRSVVIVPPKHVKLAVDRNKIKRILSEEIGKKTKTGGFNYDLAIVISKRVVRDNFSDLKKEFNDVLLKLNKT